MSPIITLHSGVQVDILEPEKTEIPIEDIAHALSNLCRFTGHCNVFYSVAQHSVIVSQVVPEEYALCGLLHDASEAIINDVATPVKRLIPQYKEIQDNVEKAIYRQYGLPENLPKCVKAADKQVLVTERRELLAQPNDLGWEGYEDIIPLPRVIRPATPAISKILFLSEYERLTDAKLQNAKRA